VLFVCTGNICRSPIAERLARAHVAGPGSLLTEFSSAGTHAVVGYPMDPPSARALRELGGDPDGHRARQLTKKDLTADLILTAKVEHRSQILRAAPEAMRRAFTLREFARLAAACAPPPRCGTADQLRARISQIGALRGQVATGVDDIADPFGAPYDEVLRCGIGIDLAVQATLAALGLAAGS
jgi:protein-tyrosine phosphatase